MLDDAKLSGIFTNSQFTVSIMGHVLGDQIRDASRKAQIGQHGQHRFQSTGRSAYSNNVKLISPIRFHGINMLILNYAVKSGMNRYLIPVI